MLSCRSSCKVRTRKKSIHPRSPNPETDVLLSEDSLPKHSANAVAMTHAGYFWVWQR